MDLQTAKKMYHELKKEMDLIKGTDDRPGWNWAGKAPLYVRFILPILIGKPAEELNATEWIETCLDIINEYCNKCERLSTYQYLNDLERRDSLHNLFLTYNDKLKTVVLPMKKKADKEFYSANVVGAELIQALSDAGYSVAQPPYLSFSALGDAYNGTHILDYDCVLNDISEWIPENIRNYGYYTSLGYSKEYYDSLVQFIEKEGIYWHSLYSTATEAIERHFRGTGKDATAEISKIVESYIQEKTIKELKIQYFKDGLNNTDATTFEASRQSVMEL